MNKCKNCTELVNYESVYCNKCGIKLKESLLDEHVSFVTDIGNGLKITTNPITFEYCFQIGANAYHKGNYYEAIEYLKYASTIDEPPMIELSNCYNELALCYIYLNKYEIANKYLELALSANPNNLISLQNRVELLCKIDVYKAIENMINLSQKTTNFNPELWRIIGVTLENLKKYPEAKKCYERAIELGVEKAEEDLQDVIRAC